MIRSKCEILKHVQKHQEITIKSEKVPICPKMPKNALKVWGLKGSRIHQVDKSLRGTGVKPTLPWLSCCAACNRLSLSRWRWNCLTHYINDYIAGHTKLKFSNCWPESLLNRMPSKLWRKVQSLNRGWANSGRSHWAISFSARKRACTGCQEVLRVGSRFSRLSRLW